MIEYFKMDGVPNQLFFKCEKLRATLGVASCIAMYQQEGSLHNGAHNSCKGCAIGADHAGVTNVSAAKNPLMCIRCHRPAMRLIRKMHCVSCYNRAREVAIGKNARGAAPVKHPPLCQRRISFLRDNAVVTVTLRETVDEAELIAAVLRDSKTPVVFAHKAKPQLRQGSLW